MSAQSPTEGDQVTKKQKTSDDNAEILLEVAAIRNNPSSPRLFQLNIYGFYEVFEWLSLKELLTLSQTCTFMQKVAGDYFRCSYGGADVAYTYGGVFVTGDPPLKINGFDEFIRKIHIYEKDDAAFQFVASKCDALKQIRFTSVILTPAKIETIKHVLRRIESIQMICVDVSERFHRGFLKCCTSLKRLSLRDFNPESIIIGTDNEWLRQKYPTLEHLELDLPNGDAIEELKIFFEENRNIRSFATNVEFFWKNRTSIEASNIKLDNLAIVGQMNDNVCTLLNYFHRHGYFKRLHLYNTNAIQEYIDRIATLDGLEKLFIGSGNRRLNLMALTSLKELALYTTFTVHPTSLAHGLVNLKRLYIRQATAKDILPFIQHSAKLIKIKIPLYFDTVYPITWNQEREKLFGASKVTIFIPEVTYLAHKWTTKNNDLNMIEIGRAESYDWLHHFFYK